MTEDTSPVPDRIVDGLLLTRDLMFTSKVTSTAVALGLRIEVVGSVADLSSRVQATRPRAVFLDLAPADIDPQQILAQLDVQPRPLVIAFGSHVDTERLQSARDAGCDEVLPRSRFSATLPELLQRVIGPAT